jgi:uncharacterized membrane protein
MEKKYMRKNRIVVALTLSLLSILSLNACAQQHSKNQARLIAMNTAIQSTVLLNNQQNLIPLTQLDKKTIASVNLGFGYQSVVDSLLNKYAKVTSFTADSYAGQSTLNSLEDDLKYYNTVVVSLTDAASNDGRNISFINMLAKSKQVIVVLFGAGNRLTAFDALKTPLIWSEKTDEEAAAVVPQLIFGGIAATSKLNKGYSPKYTAGSGFMTTSTRLK